MKMERVQFSGLTVVLQRIHASLIMFPPSEVNAAIQLDNQAMFRAIEVRDKASQWMLSAKL